LDWRDKMQTLKEFWLKYESQLSPYWVNCYSFYTWVARRPYSFANEENTLKAIIEDRIEQQKTRMINGKPPITRPLSVLFYLTEFETKTITGNDIKIALKKSGVF